MHENGVPLKSQGIETLGTEGKKRRKMGNDLPIPPRQKEVEAHTISREFKQIVVAHGDCDNL